MLLQAHAKVNLLLNVQPLTGSATYHGVDTVLYPLGLCDEVRIEPAAQEGIRLTCDPDPLAEGMPVQDNLAWRAAAAMGDAFGHPLAIDIAIRKAIPSQAGLGGGSSDAAAVIRGLASLWSVDMQDARLQEVAAGLGSDVPFFLHEVPMRFSGKGDVPGERFAPFEAPVALVKPSRGVSTVAAYRRFDELGTQPCGGAALFDALRTSDVRGIAQSTGNNMEEAARSLCPQLDEVFAFLETRAELVGPALLCGSGSCVAAFVESDASAARIARDARACGWWSAATCTLC